jgi:cell division protein FtsB
MKILLLALPLMFIAIGCNKNSNTEFQKEKQEVNKEYRENVNEAEQQRREDLNEAREDLQDQQKEEATEYVEESDAARINRGEQEVEVRESQDQ